MLTVANVELPAMPGTSYNAPGQSPFTQRTTLMRTHAVESKELAIDIEDRHNSIFDDQFAIRTRWKLKGRSYAYPIRHVPTVSQSAAARVNDLES